MLDIDLSWQPPHTSAPGKGSCERGPGAHRSLAISPAKMNSMGKRSSQVRVGTYLSSSAMKAAANSSQVTADSA